MIKKQLLMYCSPVSVSVCLQSITKVDVGPGVTYSMQYAIIIIILQ